MEVTISACGPLLFGTRKRKPYHDSPKKNLFHRGDEEARRKTLPLMNTDDTDRKKAKSTTEANADEHGAAMEAGSHNLKNSCFALDLFAKISYNLKASF
jgi:hypothetical protein